jgi:hypothetical protein
MIAGGFERLAEPPENAFSIMMNQRGLPMHEPLRPDHIAAEDFPHALMSETDAQDRAVWGKTADHFTADAGFRWGAGPRGDANPLGIQGRDFIQGDPVIALHEERGSQFAEVLHEVIGEGVVVIDDEQHERKRRKNEED